MPALFFIFLEEKHSLFWRLSWHNTIMAILGPLICTAPYVMVLMRADPIRGQVGGDWALEILTYLGPVKWHRALATAPASNSFNNLEGKNRLRA
jgi:hypothetical protein